MRALLSFVCLLGFSHAHTTFTNFFINGVAQGDGTCVRMSQTPNNATFPLPDIQAPEMACGVNGDIGVARVCSAPAGALMTFEFRERPDGKTPGAIDKSHKGPIAIYMKKVADPTANDTASGDGWFKIFQADFNSTSQKWATETLIANKGLLSVNLPQSLAGGYYLVRTELLALHEADKSPPDPQFYIGCAQIFLQGGGSAQPSNTVKIPGYISLEKNKAALTFNIYKQPMALPYSMFGPPVFTGSSSPTNQKAVVKSTEQTFGLKPDDCVLSNANWCGRELAAFSTEQGCWNASTACWSQCKDCYSSAPPTGSANCQIWERKCKGIQDQCKSGNFNGPPNRMTDLTPANKNVQVPPPAGCDDAASPAAATGSASRLFTLQQPTASASGGAGTDQTTTLHRTTFKTVTKSASPSASDDSSDSDSNAAADTTTTIFQSSVATKTIVLQTEPSSAAAAATSSSDTYQTSPAAASGSAYPSSDAAAPKADIGPDAFGSVDECGARNASAHCGGGLCCSQFGYCGGTPLHCGIGCQDGFGACDQLPANANDTSTATASASAGDSSCTDDAMNSSGAAATSAAAAAATSSSTTTTTDVAAAASSTTDASNAPATPAAAADGTDAANPAADSNNGNDGANPAAASSSTSSSSSAAPPPAPSKSATPPADPPAAPKLPDPAPPVAKPTSSVTVVVLAAKIPPKVD